MKRYYYSDPLEAAYMAREHGVELSPESDGSDYGGMCISLKRTNDDSASIVSFKCAAGKVLVEPSSHDIFHHRPGDIVRFGANRVRVFSGDFENPAAAAVYGQDVTEIIERDGKRFFWPKVEEV